MARVTIDNSEDIMDSRDIIKRIEELESDIETAKESETGPDKYDMEELETLKALQNDAEQYAEDWHHGVTLIRDSYFETYAMELAEDLGLMKKELQWPFTCIDWQQAAKELRQDYTSVEFGDVTYWMR